MYRYVKSDKDANASFRFFKFLIVLLPLLLLIDNYFEYPEIMLLVLLGIKFSHSRILSIKQNTIHAIPEKQSFEPGLAGVFLNPFYFIRRALFVNIKKLAPQLSGKLLDFGCGRKPYETLFTVDEYVGVDMEKTGHEHTNSKIDVYYDGKHIPFGDSTFDSVFCSEVFEHIFNLEDILLELNRVTKKGGKMLITVPFLLERTRRAIRLWPIYFFGIKHLLKKHGFETIAYYKSGNFTRVNFSIMGAVFLQFH